MSNLDPEFSLVPLPAFSGRPKALMPLSGDESWQEIVDRLVMELEAEHTPDKVVQAAELLLSGFPTYKVAKKLGVRTDTVRRWLTEYPTMSMISSMGKMLLSKWRMAKLEQQFLTAMERSEEILELSLVGPGEDDEGGVDPKLVAILAQHVRFVMGLFAGQKMDITVTHELGDTVMKAQRDALDYMAGKLAEQRAGDEPIEAVVRVIDAKFDNEGPMVDSIGEAPFGVMGELDTTDEGTLCHICGTRVKYLANHVRNVHTMDTGTYEDTYLLEPGSLKKLED